jgi:glycosyltransferase involved in cell wall biosynthesis
MHSIELSFCIPTFNRCTSAVRLVTDILKYVGSDIEVVVLDNGSMDGTYEFLQSIDDERLSVHTNGENKGALFNMVNVLNLAKGKFLVYTTDQDHIDFQQIGAFKQFFMKNPNLAAGYCLYSSQDSIYFYPKGFSAIKSIAFQSRHPTGYFFRNEFLQKIDFVRRFSNYEFVDLFPLDFAFADLCLMGAGAVYGRPLFRPENGEAVVKNKSSTTNGKKNTAFFSPSSRLKLAVNYSKHANSLNLTKWEKHLLFVDIFVRGLSAATLGYRKILSNNALCTHYMMESRLIELPELVDIGIDFSVQYVRNFPSLYRLKFLNRIMFSVHVVARLIVISIRKKLATFRGSEFQK